MDKDKKYEQLSFSVDEMAMLFSLINQPELGKSIMLQAYGELKPNIMDEKLTTASHSLLAREFVRITPKNTVEIEKIIERMLSGFVRFNDILQVTMNNNQPEGPEIINIYLGKDHYFTALQIKLGVVHALTYGRISDLTELVASWLNFPESNELETSNFDSIGEVSMSMLSSFDNISEKESVNILANDGFSAELAKILVQDIKSPQSRGSVILTNMNSDNYQDKSLEKAGAGFLYLQGENSCWLFTFHEAEDSTTAKIFPGTYVSSIDQLNSILGL